MRKLRMLMVAVVAVMGIGAATAVASADSAFLCPVVGDGVNHASEQVEANGANGVQVINPPVGTSFLPGKNKAGANSNPNAHNTSGPGDPDAGPGGNPDFSPIWPSS